jgi:plastocyanin
MNGAREFKAKWLAGLLVLLAAQGALAVDHVVVLKDKAFDHETLNVKLGDSVEFRNSDPFDHDVLSQSKAKTFDLDSVPPGESRKVSFDAAGTVEVECSQHSGMHLTIQVSK